MLFFEIHKVFMYAFAAFPHLASLDARELFSTKYAGVGHGTVGYADRSARCVSPPYALLPFLPRSVQRRSLRQFRLINAAKRLRKKKRESRVCRRLRQL